MYNSNIPTRQELPSTGKLIKSTIIAAVVAVLLLVVVVLPSEYGVDPTGIGNAIGLKKMGEIKVSLAKELADELVAMKEREDAKAEKAKAIAEFVQAAKKKAKLVQAVVPATQNHELKLTLAPDAGYEIKVDMKKGAKLQYLWWTDAGKANFDIHADSKVLKIKYHNYKKGSVKKSEGTLEAAFDGSHGWFWRNRSGETLTITLQIDGEYTNIKHYK